VALKCSPNYFSQSCNSIPTSSCTPTNDCTGHYTCDLNGQIVCNNGFIDPSTFCVKPNPTVSVCNPSKNNLLRLRKNKFKKKISIKIKLIIVKTVEYVINSTSTL
jgi:hypothetical protein